MRNIFVQYYSAKYPDKAAQKLMPNEPDENLLTGISSAYVEKAKNPSDIANQLDKSKDSIKAAININDSEDGLEDTGLLIMFNEDDSAIDSVEISDSRIYTLFGVQTYQAYEGTEEKLADRFVIASERDNPDGTHLAAFIRNNSEDSLVITYDSAIGYIKDVQYIRNGFEGYRAEQERIRKEAEKTNASISKKEGFLDKADNIEQYSEVYLETAETQSEINSESSAVYKKWDTLLNEVYQYLKTIMSGSEFKQLQENEIAWIAEKEQAIKAAGAEWEGGSGEAMARNMTAIQYTKERCYYLISLIN